MFVSTALMIVKFHSLYQVVGAPHDSKTKPVISDCLLDDLR